MRAAIAVVSVLALAAVLGCGGHKDEASSEAFTINDSLVVTIPDQFSTRDAYLAGRNQALVYRGRTSERRTVITKCLGDHRLWGLTTEGTKEDDAEYRAFARGCREGAEPMR